MNNRSVVAPVLPLFVGLAFLMVGNGLLGSLLGIRADLESFATVVIGVVMAMYYVGFLGESGRSLRPRLASFLSSRRSC
jgi:hypothetical protein